MMPKHPLGKHCNGVTRSARRCQRKPTVDYVQKDDTVVAHYCTQHANGAGVMRLLLPYAWEFDRTTPCELGR